MDLIALIHLVLSARFGVQRRKRRRLEHLPESRTVHKLTDLIGRGKLSISAASEIAQTVVASLFSTIWFVFGFGEPKIKDTHSPNYIITSDDVPLLSICIVIILIDVPLRYLGHLRLLTTRLRTQRWRLFPPWGQAALAQPTQSGTCTAGWLAYTISSFRLTRFLPLCKWLHRQMGSPKPTMYVLLGILMGWYDMGKHQPVINQSSTTHRWLFIVLFLAIIHH